LLQKNGIIMPKILYKKYQLNLLIVIKMPNMTLAIPDKLHKFMKEHKEIRWTEVVRRSLWDYVYKMQLMEQKETEHKSHNDSKDKNKNSKQQNII